MSQTFSPFIKINFISPSLQLTTVLPRCHRCRGLLIGPQDLLGVVFPAMVAIALAGTSYALLNGLTALAVLGLMAVGQLLLLLVSLHILMRAAGGRPGRSGFHPACYELHRLDCECAGHDALRAAVEEKRRDANLLLARLVGREPAMARAFAGRPGEGLDLEGEARALDVRIEILQRYHRRLDLADEALAAGDRERAAEQYEALGLLLRADELRKREVAPDGAEKSVLKVRG